MWVGTYVCMQVPVCVGRYLCVCRHVPVCVSRCLRQILLLGLTISSFLFKIGMLAISGKYASRGSSKVTSPLSINCSAATEVIDFVIEAITKIFFSLILSFIPHLDGP